MPSGDPENVGFLPATEPSTRSLLAVGEGGTPVWSERGACQCRRRGAAGRPPADGATTLCRPCGHHTTSIVFDPTRH